MADNIQHEDFGEKIGGAKKDLWKDRGLYVNDLDAMNEREAEKFVKKDNIWKKPDYQAMLDDGIPLGVVYFIKKARDGLNASPQYYRRDDIKRRCKARRPDLLPGDLQYQRRKPCRNLCRKWNDDPLRRPDLLCQHQYKLLAAAFLYIWASALTDWR